MTTATWDRIVDLERAKMLPMPSLSIFSSGSQLRQSRCRAIWLVLLIAWAAGCAQAQQPSPIDKARSLINEKQYKAAEQMSRKALVQDPKSAAWLTTLGLSLHMQGRSADAIYYYSMALKQRYVPETYALLAAEKCKVGDLDAVRPMLEKIYREQLKDAHVLSIVAPCYLDLDEPVEAARVYLEVLSDPDYPPDLARVMLAKSLIRSEIFFNSKLHKAPGSEPFVAALRRTPGGGSSEARSAFPEAARVSPYFSPDLSWSEAVERWQQHPQDPALLYLLFILSAEEGIRQIEICQERFPDSPYLKQYMADVMAETGHEDEAVEQYQQLIRDHPDLPDLQYGFGMLSERRGEWKEAAEAFRQQLDKYPTDEQAAENLSKCLLHSEQYAEAQAFLQPKMKAEHPPHWASLDLAEAEMKLGEVEGAIKVLAAAEREGGGDKLLHYRLMHLYSLAGRSEDAKREQVLFQAASKQ
jgi:tetratricopeptide (TPR) repeat protein